MFGLFLERRRNAAKTLPYRVPFYPLPPLFFVVVSLWTVFVSLIEAREIAVLGLAPIALGLVGYFVLRSKSRAKSA